MSKITIKKAGTCAWFIGYLTSVRDKHQGLNLLRCQVQKWFLGLVTISNQPGEQVDEKVNRAAMARVLNQRDIFGVVVNGFDDRAFAQQQVINQGQQAIFHIAAHTGNQFETGMRSGGE